MRHSTADPRVPNPPDLAAVCLRSSTAREGPTRGVPPLPTGPVPAGTIRHAGGCLQPVLLRGRVDHIDGPTGELIHRYTTVHEPGGLLPVACKTPGLPLRALRRGLPGRHLPAHPGRTDRRQGRSRRSRRPSMRVRHPHRAAVRPRPRPARAGTGCWPTARAGKAGLVRTVCACPATKSTPATMTGSASHCAPTATTTPARSCSTPTPPSCGAGLPSRCAGRWPARPD